MSPDLPEGNDFRRVAVATLMLATFLGSANMIILYPDYWAATAFCCVLVELLLVLSYANRPH